jgi:hypothetical protein
VDWGIVLGYKYRPEPAPAISRLAGIGAPYLEFSAMRLLYASSCTIAVTLAGASAAWALPIMRLPQPTIPPAVQLRALVNASLLNSGVRNPNVRVVTTHVDLELEADDATKLRTGFLPEIFDEKGTPKRYTKDEVAALKGDSNLPGFKAVYDDLKPGQMVRVLLGPKDSEKKDSKDDNKKDDKDKKNDAPKPVTLPVNELAGKVTHVEGTTKKFVVRVEIKTLANPIVAALSNVNNNVNKKDKDAAQEIPVDRKVKLVVIETPDPAGKEKK